MYVTSDPIFKNIEILTVSISIFLKIGSEVTYTYYFYC